MVPGASNWRKVRIILLLLFLNVACSNNTGPVSSNPFDRDNISAVVQWVTDGDTFHAKIGESEEKVRVLYIDCFETSPGARLDGQAEEAGITSDSALKIGLEAKSFAETLLKGKTVTLTRVKTEEDKDVYGRLLRIVSIGGSRYDSIMLAKHYALPNY